MALLNCPECNHQVSDTAKSCPNCGFAIMEYLEKEKLKHQAEIAEKERKEKERILREERELKRKNAEIKKQEKVEFIKKNKWKIIVFFCVFILLVSVFIISKNVIEKKALQEEFDTAVSAYEKGDYKTAYEYFNESTMDGSIEYLEKTVQAYARQALDEDDLGIADVYIQRIQDESIKKELEEILIYKRAVSAYETGTFGSAETLFKSISTSEKYKTEVKEYLELVHKMDRLQGQWYLQGSVFTIEDGIIDCDIASIRVNGWDATFYHCADGSTNEAGRCTLTFDDKGNYIFDSDNVKYNIKFRGNSSSNNASLVVDIIKDSYFKKLKKSDIPYYMWTYYNTKYELVFYRESYGKYIPSVESSQESSKEEPCIGMTHEEVEKSTWGMPDDINKTTYSWGTTEQWCYSNNKYIYFDNGIVTAISE